MQAAFFRASEGAAWQRNSGCGGQTTGRRLSLFRAGGRGKKTPDAAQRAKTGRPSFILRRGHPKLFIAKQKTTMRRLSAPLVFFAEQTASETTYCRAKTTTGRCARWARKPSLSGWRNKGETGKPDEDGGMSCRQTEKKCRPFPFTHRQCGKKDASDGATGKEGAATTLKAAEQRREGRTRAV